MAIFLDQEPIGREPIGREPINIELYEYVHFKTSYQCDTFIDNNPHLNIQYKCCGGKGVAYPKTKIKAQLNYVKKIEKITKGICDICFLDEFPLSNKCNQCIQPFCTSCLSKIVSKICPYCRGILS